MKRSLALLGFFLVFLLLPGPFSMKAGPAPAFGGARYALVIGNANYKVSPLKNPANDATDMAQILEKLGFSVTRLVDATLLEMEREVRRFGKRLDKGDVGLFYYAGHGLQVDGRNYLVSVDAEIHEEFDIKYESLDANFVLDVMDHSDNELNIVILDACRDNPFSRSFRGVRSGLAKMEAPIGTIISYATAPGQVAADGDGRNGLYTGHLLANIRAPGLTIEEVFKRVRNSVAEDTNNRQVPWESTSLRGTFCFSGCEKPAQPAQTVQTAAPVPSSPGKIDKQLELAFWNAIEDSKEPESFSAYIEKFPNGTFTPLAKIKLEKLNNRNQPADPVLTAKKTEPKVEPKPQTKVEPKPQPKVEAKPEPELLAKLTVQTEPSHARVSFSNGSRSYAPDKPLKPGYYEFTVTADGYEPQTKSVRLGNGEDKTVRVVLKKKKGFTTASINETLDNLKKKVKASLQNEQQTVLLSLSGSPKGAAVYVDGKKIGRLPLDKLELEKGSHKVRVSADGYRPHETVVTLKESREISITLRKLGRGGKKVAIFPWNLKGPSRAHMITILNYLAQRMEEKGGFALKASYYPLDKRFSHTQLDSSRAAAVEDATWKKDSFFSNPKPDLKSIQKMAGQLGVDLVIIGELKVSQVGVSIFVEDLRIHIIRASDGRMRSISRTKRLDIYMGDLSTELPSIASEMMKASG